MSRRESSPQVTVPSEALPRMPYGNFAFLVRVSARTEQEAQAEATRLWLKWCSDKICRERTHEDPPELTFGKVFQEKT